MIIQVIVEDGLKEVVESRGAKEAIEQAVFKKLFELRDALHDRQSRQSVMPRGYMGTTKE